MSRSGDEGFYRPSQEFLLELADRANMALDDEEVSEYLELVDALLTDVGSLDDLPPTRVGPERPGSSQRTPGYRPTADEDPHNAWILKCWVDGAPEGPLSGVEVGLKDTVALAGYELTAGSAVMEGFVPQIDATVVRRLLDAGAVITGKHNMESFAHSGTGDISDFGSVSNPRDTDYLAGGSSSGSAAAVAAEECDIALGTDQGGSIRTPAAWCGIVGLKPTTGLVPYTGVLPIDLGVDAVGPLARNVHDVAQTLEVIAGVDVQDEIRLDARQPWRLSHPSYTEALDGGPEDLTIGVLEEGFGLDDGNDDIDTTVRDALADLEAAGAELRSVSVPLHRYSPTLLTVLAVSGYTRLLQADWVGTNHNGWYWRSLAEVFSRFRRSRGHDLPVTVKKSWLTGEVLRERYGTELYAKAKNVSLDAERQYDETLTDCDVLAMPTTPVLPARKEPDLGRIAKVQRAHDSAANTAIFSLTHHPALTVPCGTLEGLPVGVMFVGRHFDEVTVLRAGAMVEETLG